MELCVLQRNAGNDVLFEHPLGASSWRMPKVQNIADLNKVHCVRADLCMYDMTTADGSITAPAMKPTRFMTNSRCLSRTLSLRCDGKHTHLQVVNVRAHKAEIYPAKLCVWLCCRA